MDSLSGGAVGWHLVEERQRSVKRLIHDGTEPPSLWTAATLGGRSGDVVAARARGLKPHTDTQVTPENAAQEGQ
jgi:hypothetical protein